MSEANDEKRKSLINSREDIKEARVVANYGDPGLDEDYHFDILSRYVIVQLDSCKRVPTSNKWSSMFAIVARPQHLWIDAPEGKSSSPSSQKRSDAVGNVNVGTATSPSVNGIARINQPYELGEIIKIKKIPLPVNTDTS